jgi:hypothetical protein
MPGLCLPRSAGSDKPGRVEGREDLGRLRLAYALSWSNRPSCSPEARRSTSFTARPATATLTCSTWGRCWSADGPLPHFREGPKAVVPLVSATPGVLVRSGDVGHTFQGMVGDWGEDPSPVAAPQLKL